jgi:hypothetical protein
MNRTTLIHQTTPLLSAIALTSAWLCAAAASGQTSPGTSDAQSGSPAVNSMPNSAQASEVLRIYSLHHADPGFVARVLQTMVAGGPMKLNIDSRTSALIVSGSREVQEKVAELLQRLDVPAGKGNAEQIRFFTLVYVDPESAAKTLKAMVPNLQVATEQRTRSVLAAGSPDALAAVEALLTKLDRESDHFASVASYEVRVFWLASGLTGEGVGAPPADDLKDVVVELSRQGIKDLRQVGEIAVQTMTGRDRSGNFQVTGSPRFGEGTAEFNASGQLSKLPNGALVMRTHISASAGPAARAQNLNRIETEIVLPEKQYVVLAAAPTGSQTSVFVVQVVRSDKPAEKKDGKPAQDSTRR